jgi:hypothetical protein
MLISVDACGNGTLGAAARERARVRQHLAGAERAARRRGGRLEPLAALCRALLLEELGRYRRGGRFPRNPGHARPLPQFIDAHGTRCAVAHLMDISGQGALVRQIARTENDATVHALARLPEVRAWLAAAGLSVDEAARIQPSYCYYVEADACFCNLEREVGEPDPTGLAVGTVIALDAQTLRIRVDRIGGTLPGLAVGDEREMTRRLNPDDGGESYAVGSQLLVGYHDSASASGLDAGAGPVLARVHSQLRIEGGSVTCDYNAVTAVRPVSVDTAFEALLAMGSECVDVLASDDSGWNQRTCDNPGIVPDPGASGSGASESGCGIPSAGSGGLDADGLTSAALLVALFIYRRQRG